MNGLSCIILNDILAMTSGMQVFILVAVSVVLIGMAEFVSAKLILKKTKDPLDADVNKEESPLNADRNADATDDDDYCFVASRLASADGHDLCCSSEVVAQPAADDEPFREVKLYIMSLNYRDCRSACPEEMLRQIREYWRSFQGKEGLSEEETFLYTKMSTLLTENEEYVF